MGTTADKILTDAGNHVKAQIVAAGVAFGRLAREAGLSQANLSNHLGGRRRSEKNQIAVWRAFCRLAKARKIDPPTLPGFWGALLNERLAA